MKGLKFCFLIFLHFSTFYFYFCDELLFLFFIADEFIMVGDIVDICLFKFVRNGTEIVL